MNQFLAHEIAQVVPVAYGIGLFVSTASFLAPVQTQGATGNSVGGYTAISGLQNIQCMNAPSRTGAAGTSSMERRTTPFVEAERSRHVLLNGYFPQLDTGPTHGAGTGWQVNITDPGGNTNQYIFLGGEGDSQQTQTRCNLELVTL